MTSRKSTNEDCRENNCRRFRYGNAPHAKAEELTLNQGVEAVTVGTVVNALTPRTAAHPACGSRHSSFVPFINAACLVERPIGTFRKRICANIRQGIACTAGRVVEVIIVGRVARVG